MYPSTLDTRAPGALTIRTRAGDRHELAGRVRPRRGSGSVRRYRRA